MGRKERKKEEKVCALWLPLPTTGNGVAAIMQIVATGKGTFGGDSVCPRLGVAVTQYLQGGAPIGHSYATDDRERQPMFSKFIDSGF